MQAAVPTMTPKDAHTHILSTHGQVNIAGKPVCIWGGNGLCVLDIDGSRNFEQYRAEVDRLGKEYGCHTCGRFQGEDSPFNPQYGKPAQHWVCDHQPPLGIIPEATSFQLYPQCIDCSQAQWGRSKIYINSFLKHVGRIPGPQDQHLFWANSGRAHRTTANYG
jgi:hypothetical protein